MIDEIVAELGPEQGVTRGTWFGLPCLKVGGKLFAALSGGDMAFKLTGEAHAEALRVEGAHLFDPHAKGQPMKAWVQIPGAQSSTWSHFARLACDGVAGAAQAEKDGIIRGLVSARQKILDSVRLLSPAEQDEIFLGEWSAKDLLAHLAGWDYTNLAAVDEIRAGQKPSFWEHYDRDWRRYNALLVARYRRDDFAELVAVVERSHRELIDHLEAVPAEEYLNRKKIGTLLRTEARDEETHFRQLEEFRKRASART